MKPLIPYGFRPIFFKHFWEVVGEDVWQFNRETFGKGYSDDRVAKTLLVLIPKVDHHVHLNNFRPISLCIMVYKVLTRVLIQ